MRKPPKFLELATDELCPDCGDRGGVTYYDNWDDAGKHILAGAQCGNCGHIFYEWSEPNGDV